MLETSTSSTGAQADSAEPVDYRWTTTVADAAGQQRPALRGEGRFDAEDAYTAGAHRSHTAVAAAVFADVCDEVVEYHRDAVLDARVDGQPDPVPPVLVTTTVFDAHDNAVAILTGRLLHRPVTEDEVADAAVLLGQIAVDDARLRIERVRHPDDGNNSHPDPLPPPPGLDVEHRPDTVSDGAGAGVDENLRERLWALRAAAAELRAEVYDPEYCRHQLGTMEAAPAATHTLPSATPPGTEERPAEPLIDWQARVDRWRRLLEISTEAYLDAAGLDATAEHIRRGRHFRSHP